MDLPLKAGGKNLLKNRLKYIILELNLCTWKNYFTIILIYVYCDLFECADLLKLCIPISCELIYLKQFPFWLIKFILIVLMQLLGLFLRGIIFVIFSIPNLISNRIQLIILSSNDFKKGNVLINSISSIILIFCV